MIARLMVQLPSKPHCCILDKMLHDNYIVRLVESNKQQIKEVKRKTRNNGQLLSESGLVVCIAPLSLSRDRRIKIKKSINQSYLFLYSFAHWNMNGDKYGSHIIAPFKNPLL